YDFDFATAEGEFDRSLELNPRYPLAHYWFGFFLGLMGRYEEGYTEFKRAIRLDPLSAVIRWGLGFMYWCSRRYDEAVESLGKALELNPAFAGAHGVLGWTCLCKSLHKQAIVAGQRAAEISQGAPTFLVVQSPALFALGPGYAAVSLPRVDLELLRLGMHVFEVLLPEIGRKIPMADHPR